MNMRLKVRAAWTLGVVLGVLSACGGGSNSTNGPPPPPPVPGVATISVAGGPAGNIFGLTESSQLVATLMDSAGNILIDRRVTWASSNVSVVSVSQAGFLIAIAPGNASVVASSEGKSGTLNVEVSSAGFLRIAAPTYSLQPETSSQFTALKLDASDHTAVANVTWTSSDEAVLTVSDTGLVSALTIGSAVVTATLGRFTESVRIGVQQPVRGRIAFYSQRGAPVGTYSTPHGGLYTMNVDGSHQNLLIEDALGPCTVDPTPDVCDLPWGNLSWSTDGMRFATYSERTYEPEYGGPLVFLCTTADAFCDPLQPFPQTLAIGRSPMPLLASAPAWSPDGTLLAYLMPDGIEFWRPANYSFTAVPTPAALASPSHLTWSPDGARFVVAAALSIWVLNTDGTNVVRLTDGTTNDSNPEWSPDGGKIAFVSGRDGNSEIYVMNDDGTSQTNLTLNSASDDSPSWSPDGTRIAFQSDRDGNLEIYVMDADGANPVNLTNNPAPDSAPVWGR